MKKIKITLLAYTAFCFCFLQSCVTEPSTAVDQDKIFVTYELYYDKNADKTYARATFQFSNALGTKLQLASPSEVRFNNDVLTYNAVIAYYEREYAGLVTSGTFKWTDAKNKVYTNPVAGIKATALPAPMPLVKKGNSTELFWVGDALDADEKVWVSMNSAAVGDLQVFERKAVAATSVILDANKIQNLPTGQNITTIIRRYKDIPVTQKTSAGAVMITHYQGANVTIQVQP